MRLFARQRAKPALRPLIFLLSLKILCAFGTDAIPWREKDALRTAGVLPKRLIDSIMARGNWEILFQKSPFREFQRLLAIAEHFSLHGDHEQAQHYLRRAAVALEIAYASLRSRFEWPRSPSGLKADDLPWGENRDTFRDYILCRLQHYLESGLHRLSIGQIEFEKIADQVERAEKQLGQKIAERDSDLALFIRLLREVVELRRAAKISHGARALHFRTISNQVPLSVQSYWGRKRVLLQIREHIHYGNLGLSQALVEFLLEHAGEPEDRIAMARFFIQSSDLSRAISLLQEEFLRSDVRRSDSHADFARLSEMLQNALVWQSRYAEAAAIAQESSSILENHIAENNVPREEQLALRRSAANQKLRSELLRYLARGECPATLEPARDDAPQTTWRIRERFFYEQCGYPRVKEDWQNWLAEKNIDTEAASLVRFTLGIADDKKKSAKTSAALLRALSLYEELTRGKINPAKRREKALELLFAANSVQSDLVLLDWGIKLPDNMIGLALNQLRGKLSKPEAVRLFDSLHRGYVVAQLRGLTLHVFAPEDAAFLAAQMGAWILGADLSNEELALQAMPGNMLYADENTTLFYSAPRASLQIYGKMAELTAHELEQMTNQTVLAFGGVLAYAASFFPPHTEIIPMPVRAPCSDCSIPARLPSRLLTALLEEKNWQKTRSELEDLFSAHFRLREAQSCNFDGEFFLDTVMLSGDAGGLSYPCTFLPTNFIFEQIEGKLSRRSMALLWAAPGWKAPVILLPKGMNSAARTAFLFDFLQRRRKEANPRSAFNEALERAKKSFATRSDLEAVRIYAPAD